VEGIPVGGRTISTGAGCSGRGWEREGAVAPRPAIHGGGGRRSPHQAARGCGSLHEEVPPRAPERVSAVAGPSPPGWRPPVFFPGSGRYPRLAVRGHDPAGGSPRRCSSTEFFHGVLPRRVARRWRRRRCSRRCSTWPPARSLGVRPGWRVRLRHVDEPGAPDGAPALGHVGCRRERPEGPVGWPGGGIPPVVSALYLVRVHPPRG